MIKDKKKVIIMIIIIVSIVTFFFVSKNIFNKRIEPLPEVKLNNKIEKNKAMAIMVTNDNGIGYKEYNENKWPEGYNFKKAECVDNNGNQVKEAVTYDGVTNKVTLKTKRTVYCTLYFEEDTILNKLRKNDSNKVISTDLVGDLYRYQGVRTKEAEDATHKLVDNNYICFGTNNEGECKDNPDKYMYRIIGVTSDNELKVIKMTGVEENNIYQYVWNDTYYYDTTHGEESCPNGECPEWNESLLFKRLNGLSNGNISGSGATENKGNTNIFINNKNYPYMVEGNNWYNLIEERNWMYGDIYRYNEEIANENTYGTNNDGLTIYQIETGKIASSTYDNICSLKKYQWNAEKSVKAKVGLMYLHDYYLAYDNTNDWSYWSSKFNKNNWMYNNVLEWTMTRVGIWLCSNYKMAAYPIRDDGSISDWTIDHEFEVRPVFYIKNEIDLDGVGTKENPYVISNKNEQGEKIYDYEYTGDIREFVVPEDGTYKLEVWGAQGGSTVGGKGGYASGYITLTSGQKIFIVVGENPIGLTGGYNGGGDGNEVQQPGIRAGGGATHIATASGLLRNLNNNKQSVLIVAAGGGGGVPDAVGGNGGGVNGERGINSLNPETTNYVGHGGTLSSAGACPTDITGDCGGFGYGGSATGQTYGGAGGGAGYYGGSQSSRGHAGAGGGSSYTGGVTAYNNDQPKNISGSDEQPSPKGGNQTGNSGNGFARITKLS